MRERLLSGMRAVRRLAALSVAENALADLHDALREGLGHVEHSACVREVLLGQRPIDAT